MQVSFDLTCTTLLSIYTLVYTTFDHSYNRHLVPAPFILGSVINERQQTGMTASSAGIVHSSSDIPAGYFAVFGTSVTANGTSNNTFTYSDSKGNTYNRDVDAAYDVITYDMQSGSLATTALPTSPSSSVSKPQPMPGARLPGARGQRLVGTP